MSDAHLRVQESKTKPEQAEINNKLLDDSGAHKPGLVSAGEHQKNARHPAADAQPKELEMTDPYKDKAKEGSGEKAAEKTKAGEEFKPERRYETADLMKAVEAARKTGLPLVVNVGESWCPHCEHMEKSVWPQVEGTSGEKGSLQGKAIFLHLDYDKSEELKSTTDASKFAAQLRTGVEGFPTIRVYKIDPNFNVHDSKKVLIPYRQTSGEMPRAFLEEFLKSGIN
jgi:hypothetical protein